MPSRPRSRETAPVRQEVKVRKERPLALPAPAAAPRAGEGEPAFATAHAPAPPDALPGVHPLLRSQVRQLRQALGAWTEAMHGLEQSLCLIELLCDPPSTTGSSDAVGDSPPGPANLLPLLQTLLARQTPGGGDLAALLAHPALAGLLGRQS